MPHESEHPEDLDQSLTSDAPSVGALATGNGRKLSTVLEIAKVLAVQQDLESMLPQLLPCLVDTLEAAEAGLLLLYDPSDGRLAVGAAEGYDLTILGPLRLAPGQAMCGKAFQTSRIELYPAPDAIATARADLPPENRELFEAATTGQAQAVSAVCLPLFTGETKVGVLMLENRRQPGSFASDDLPLLEALGALIALSIENTRLTQERQATQTLDEANRLKAELVSMLAHEMRTPLTSIKGYATALLMEETAFAPEVQHEFLQIIDEECDVLQDLIHDLLESSVIDAGLLRLEPQPVRLPRLVGEVIKDVAHHTEEHRFVVDFSSDFPIVDADPNRIAQVLRNLLDNAVKYSPQGGLVVVRGEVHREEVVVSVADQGVGIAPEHLNRLFEKFFRVESGMGRHVVGSGLGLPISLTIIESHGGRIWAESQIGEGSTFYFTLPVKGPSQKTVEREEGQDG